MKTKRMFLCMLMCSLLCTFVACGSDDDEPQQKPEDNPVQPADPAIPDNPQGDPAIPEGLVSAEEFLNIVDGKVWCFDKDYEGVWVNAEGEEFPEDALICVGSSLRALSFKDGKMAILLWPPFVKAKYKDYVYEETSGKIFLNGSEDPAYIIESITPERIVFRSWIDEVPGGVGKDEDSWTEEDRELQKDSYFRAALKVASEEATRNYLENYVE